MYIYGAWHKARSCWHYVVRSRSPLLKSSPKVEAQGVIFKFSNSSFHLLICNSCIFTYYHYFFLLSPFFWFLDIHLIHFPQYYHDSVSQTPTVQCLKLSLDLCGFIKTKAVLLRLVCKIPQAFFHLPFLTSSSTTSLNTDKLGYLTFLRCAP